MSQYLFHKPGRSLILQTFTDSVPTKSITELQSELGLSSSCVSVLPFVDALQVTRANVYKHLFESLKDKLEDALRNSDEATLLKMLQTCFKYITVAQLRSILVTILMKLERIPTKYLRDLGNPKLHSITQELPLDLRRKVWDVDTDYFRSVVREALQACTDITPIHRRSDSPICTLCQQIASSLRLFDAAASVIVQQVKHDKTWASYMYHILMGLQEAGFKIPELGKLYALALIIDAANRANSMDVTVIDNLFEILDSLVQSQERHETLPRKQVVNNRNEKGAPRNSVPQPAVVASPSKPLKLEKSASFPTKKEVAAPDISVSPQPPTQPVELSPTVKAPGPPVPSASETVQWASVDLLAVLENAYAYVQKLDKFNDFKYPVTEAIAPGYFTKISHPMDLSTIGAKLSQYTSLNEFDADVKLMIDNCLAYNNHASPIVKDAKDIWKKWQNKKASLIRAPPPQRSSKSTKVTKPPVPATATLSVDDYCADPVNQLTGDALADALENAWAYLSNFDGKIGSVFAAPVTDAIAPNYSSIITSPMDLGTMQSKLFKYKSIADFENDLKLMLENCMTYNGSFSDYGKLALKLWAKWNVNKATLFAGQHVDVEDIEVEEGDEMEQDVEEEEDDTPVKPHRAKTKRKHVKPEDDNFEEESDVEEEEFRPKRKKSKRAPAPTRPAKKVSSKAPQKLQYTPIQNISKLTTTPSPASVNGKPKTLPSNSFERPSSLHVTKKTVEALPSMQAKGKLLWALVAICDEKFQSLLLDRLCIRLLSMTSKSRLPAGDKRLEFLLQLCLLPAGFSGKIASISTFITRVALPHLVAKAYFSHKVSELSIPESVDSGAVLSCFLDTLSAKLSSIIKTDKK